MSALDIEPQAHEAPTDPPNQGTSNQWLPVKPTTSTLRDRIEPHLELFLDQHGVVYAFVRTESPTPRHRAYRLKSKTFQVAIRQLFPELPLDRRSIQDLVDELEAKGQREDKRNELQPRINREGEKLYLDLCDDQDQLVEIDSTGWRITRQHKPMFVRYPHQQAIKAPEPTTTTVGIECLDSILPDFEPSKKLLSLAWLTSCFNPTVETPIAAIIGPPGSGKSTLCRMIKALVDPSSSPDVGNIRTNVLPLVLQQHGIPCLENVSPFGREIADQLCRATTGGSIVNRTLFTNDDAVVLRYRRPILLNGVELPSTRPDLLDRTLVFDLSRRRSNEAVERVEARLNQQRPQILGQLLTLVQRTLASNESQQLDCPFRMASFAIWGRKLAKALGMREQDFDLAYSHSLKSIGTDLLEIDLHVRLISELASRHTIEIPWQDSITALLQRLSNSIILKEHAGKEGLVCSPKALNQKLKELAPILNRIGIHVEQLPRTNSVRPWRIYSVPQSNNSTGA